MQYILDDNGYVYNAALGCTIECEQYGPCTEYTGTVPAGYTSIEEWLDNANINAYKIVSGNLVLDPVKLAELESEEAREAEENRAITAKELYNVLKISSEVNNEEFTAEKKGDNLMILENAGPYTVPAFSFSKRAIWNDLTGKTWNELKNALVTWDTIGRGTPVNGVEFATSTKNLLPVEFDTVTQNGVTVTVNGDGSITLNGTATANTELILAGTDTNTAMLFSLRQGITYVKSGLGDLTLKLYEYDGTDRTLIDSNGNGTLTVNSITRVTEATLYIPSGKELNKVTISPQLEIGATATEFTVNKRSYLKADVSIDNGDVLTFTSGAIKFNGKTVGYGDGLKTFGVDTVFMVSLNGVASVTYYLPNVIEALKTMKITADRIDLEGYTTINEGFSVDLEGNMKCKDAEMKNVNIIGGNVELIGEGQRNNIFNIFSEDRQKQFYATSNFLGLFNFNTHDSVQLSISDSSEFGTSFFTTSEQNFFCIGAGAETKVKFDSKDNAYKLRLTGGNAIAENGTWVNGSLETRKKQIKEYKENALSIVNKNKIYSYLYKTENENADKHYGFVIPSTENSIYKAPKECITGGKGIDTYSMCAILWKAVQELTAEVETLKEALNND